MQYPSHEYAISMREREAWPLVLPPYSPSRAGANPGNTDGPEDNLHPGDVGPPKKKKGGAEPRTQKRESQGSFIYFWRLPLLSHSKKNSKCARMRAAPERLRSTGKWYVNETNKWSVNTYVNESTWHKHKHKHKHKRKQHTITQTQHTGTVDLISKLFVDISFRSPHIHVDTCPLHWPTCNLRADSSHATRGHFSFFWIVWEAAGNYPHNTSRIIYNIFTAVVAYLKFAHLLCLVQHLAHFSVSDSKPRP